MGNSSQKRSKDMSLDLGKCHEFEVLMSPYGDNTSQNSNNLNHSWRNLQFLYKNTYLSVIKDGKEIEIIKFCNSFEVSNEQQEEFIFTIRFLTNDNLLHRWKIRCNSLEEYVKWTTFIKESLRNDWKKDKKCQVNFI